MINKAKWIWSEPISEVNEYIDIVRDFELRELSPSAIIQISADSEYLLYINGALVSLGQFSDHPDHKIFDEIEIGEHLRLGKNRVAVRGYYQGESGLRYKAGERGIAFALSSGSTLVLSDSSAVARISPDYKSGRIHLTNWFMGFGFEYHAEGSDSFASPEYPLGEEWLPCIEKPLPSLISPRPIKKLKLLPKANVKIIAQGSFIRRSSDPLPSVLMQTDYLSSRRFDRFFEGSKAMPVSLSEPEREADGIYFIVDLGEERCGYLHFELTAQKGTRIDISHGEHLEDLRVRARVNDNNFADTYFCREGKQSFTHYTRRIACRYIEVHISSRGPISVNYFGLLPLEYPFGGETELYISDGIHEKIFETCKRTLKLCMHEHYEDGPWREQALYGSDARNASACAYYTLGGSAEFTRASLRLLAESVLCDTYVNLCAPAVRLKTIPSFTMLWFLAVREYTDFSGDLSFAKEHLPLMKRMIGNITANERDGILKPVPIDGVEPWNFYEWSEDQAALAEAIKKNGDRIEDGLYHAFAYIAVCSAASVAQKLGESELSGEYLKRAEAMREAFNRKFWDGDRGVFCSHLLDGKPMRYDELTQAIALFSGIAYKEREESLLCALAEPKGDLVKLSLSYMIYKHEALLSRGKKYADTVFSEISRIWGGMLLRGATTFWECEGGTESYSIACSLCHAWSATPIIIYAKYVLGIEYENGSIAVNRSPAAADYFKSFKAILPMLGVEIEGSQKGENTVRQLDK